MAVCSVPLRDCGQLVLTGALDMVSRQADPQPFLECSKTL